MVVAPSIGHQQLQSLPPPPPGAQSLMIAGGDNLPGANLNETNPPAGVNQVPNGAGDEAANNGVAVDDPANNRG